MAITYQENVEHVKEAFKASRGRYASPRVLVDLKAKKISICKNTVAKIMKNKELIARKKRAFKVVILEEEIKGR